MATSSLPLHPARVRLDERVRLVREAERLEQVGGAPLEVGPAHALQATLEDEVLAPGRLAVDARGLRDVADRAPHGPRLGARRRGPRRSRVPRPAFVSVARMRTVVDLPAPFGPSRPKTSPSGTEKRIPSRARTSLP